MNIAVISYWSCPLTRLGVLTEGGMNVYVLNLANSLGKLGARVDIFTRTHKENDEKIIAIHPNVRIIHLASLTYDLPSDAQIFTGKLMAFLTQNNLSYDMIHSHYFYSGKVALELKKLLNLPIVHTFHTLGTIKARLAGINDQKRIKIEKAIVKEVSGIIASTELEKQELRQKYETAANKVFVVSPGVNHHLFKKHKLQYARAKLSLPQTYKIILFVGRIDPIKGINFLISALCLLRERYPSLRNKLRVVLIGGDIESRHFWENREVQKIIKYIEKNKLQCCVKFIGSQPHSLLPLYYSAADLVAMPSIYESFGFVLLEAMASGATVLASKAGGLKYLIKDKINGRLFENGNVDQLCKLTYELLNDKTQRVRLGKNAAISSQQFCWDKQAKKFITVYKKYL